MGGDLDAKIDIAVAIYLATYFDLNKSGVKYFDQNKNDPCLVSFKK